jgi:hypothetical protein
MPGNRLTRLWEWLRDAPTLAGLWLLDRIAGQHPKTEADRIRERRRARLRRAFPGLVAMNPELPVGWCWRTPSRPEARQMGAPLTRGEFWCDGWHAIVSGQRRS